MKSNKKGQLNIGWLIVVAATIIVGLVLLDPISSFVSRGSQSIVVVNQTATAPTKGSYTDLTGTQELFGTYTIRNNTGDSIGTNNISLVEIIGTDGSKTVAIYNNDATQNSKAINLSYTYGPEGYIDDSGGRTVSGLIVLFFGIAIFIVSIPSVRNGVFDMLGK